MSGISAGKARVVGQHGVYQKETKPDMVKSGEIDFIQCFIQYYCSKEKSRGFSFGLYRSDWAYKWGNEGVGSGRKQGLMQSQEGGKITKSG